MNLNQKELMDYIYCAKRYNLDIIFNENKYTVIDCLEYLFNNRFVLMSNKDTISLITDFCNEYEVNDDYRNFFMFKIPLIYEKLVKRLRIDYLSFLPNMNNILFSEKIEDNNLLINFSGIGKTNLGALRAFVFTNLNSKHEVFWSPLHMAQWEYLKKIYTKEGIAPGQSAKLFVIGFNKKVFVERIDKYYMKNYFKDDLNESMNNLLKDKEIKTFKAKFPCPDLKCKYIGICKP